MQHNEMNPELQAKLDGAESLDDVVRICEEAGIAVSREQLEAMDVPMADGELTEELDAVSGGSVAGWILWYWWRNRGRNRSSGGGGNGSFGGGGRAGGR